MERVTPVLQAMKGMSTYFCGVEQLNFNRSAIVFMLVSVLFLLRPHNPCTVQLAPSRDYRCKSSVNSWSRLDVVRLCMSFGTSFSYRVMRRSDAFSSLDGEVIFTAGGDL